MFESEIYSSIRKEHVPKEALVPFLKTTERLTHRSLLHWTEHCTECAMPSCFKTCDLYSARVDGKCARFVKGIEPISGDKMQPGSVLKVSFKQWGVLASQGNHFLMEKALAHKVEENDLKTARLIHKTPLPAVKKKLIQKRYSVKKNKVKANLNQSAPLPDYFHFECFMPRDKKVDFQLTIRNEEPKFSKIPFQYKITLKQGYNREIIPFDEIEKRIQVNLNYRIDLTPLNATIDDVFYFGLLEFVKFNEQPNTAEQASKIKCVVWDLDHTIWHGILTEVGIEGLKLREGIKHILETLDQRGIVHSIVSKNDSEPALEALKHFGLDHYFIFPQISWKPKSQGIRNIARNININLNTLLFVDDSEFERQEVSTVFPQLMTLDALKTDEILDMKQLQVAATDEAKNRKKLYQNEEVRKQQADVFDGEYLEFLKSCQIELRLSALKKEHFDRVYELTQRTNQMNFSGNRYKKEDIAAIAANPQLDKYVMSCSDRFGDYGIVGLGIVDKDKNQLVDLMFSCRIQSKRIEHAFMSYCLGKYLPKGDFKVKYKRTERNKFSAQVFDDFGFSLLEKKDNSLFLNHPSGKTFPNEKIVSVTD